MIDWGDGEYEATARELAAIAEVVVDRAAIQRGDRVVDVGCGTGNGALAAARRGAQVTAIDPAARLLEVARRRAAEERLSVAFAPGDAAGLEAGGFDAAIAIFSVIFAPDAAAAVAGVLRALRPGGRAVLTTWIPDGPVHEALGPLIEAAWSDAPPSPWRDERSIHALFAPHAAAVSIAEGSLTYAAESAAVWLDAQIAKNPGWRAIRRTLEPDPDRYAALYARSLAALEEGNEVRDGFRITTRYRIVRADLASVQARPV